MDLAQSWTYIEQVATERLENNKTERHVSEYGEYIEVIGAAGELAARRFLHMDETLHTHFDRGADMLFKGIRIDVKATIWTPKLIHRHLQWPIMKPMASDVILLTAINIPEKKAIMVGFAMRYEMARAPINAGRRYPCHEIPIVRLHKTHELFFVDCKDQLYARAKAQAHRGDRYYRAGAQA